MPGEPRTIVNPGDIRAKKNSTGATLAKGTVVKLSAANDDLILKPAAIADAAYGVTMSDILDGQWGDVQLRGIALVLAGTGGVTRGDRLTHDTAGFGRVSTAAPAGGTNNAFVGVANRSAAVGVLTEVELAAPGGQIQG